VREPAIDWNEGQGTVSPESTQAHIDGTSPHHLMLGLGAWCTGLARYNIL